MITNAEMHDRSEGEKYLPKIAYICFSCLAHREKKNKSANVRVQVYFYISVQTKQYYEF